VEGLEELETNELAEEDVWIPENDSEEEPGFEEEEEEEEEEFVMTKEEEELEADMMARVYDMANAYRNSGESRVPATLHNTAHKSHCFLRSDMKAAVLYLAAHGVPDGDRREGAIRNCDGDFYRWIEWLVRGE
jgi:hypothetical protein